MTKLSVSPYIAERINRKKSDFRIDTFSTGGPFLKKVDHLRGKGGRMLIWNVKPALNLSYEKTVATI